jgi:hypothetical protein
MVEISWTAGRLKRLMAALIAVLPLLWPEARDATAAEAVDLELVIATDVSYSIDEEEATLQRQGVVQAFRSEEVIRAITSGVLGKIAVAYIDFSSRVTNRVVADWQVIRDRATANAFADRLAAASLTRGMHTSISDGIELARALIETNAIEGTRRVIDVSGDGPNNFGRLVDDVRDDTIARRITINGLPIMNERGAFASRYYLPDLDLYFRGCVIGGPGAFIVVANNFVDFARAIRRKLILEIAGLAPRDDRPSRPLPIPAAAGAQPRPSPDGYTYPRGCDIGERMRGAITVEP